MYNILSKSYLSLSEVSILMGFTGKTIYDKNKKTMKFLKKLEKRMGVPIMINMGSDKKSSWKFSKATIEQILSPSGDICLMEELKNLKELVLDLKLRIEFLETNQSIAIEESHVE